MAAFKSLQFEVEYMLFYHQNSALRFLTVETFKDCLIVALI